MKKFFIILFSLIWACSIQAQNASGNYGQWIFLQVMNVNPYDDPTTTIKPPGRSSEEIIVYLDDHTLYFGDDSHPAFTLTLLDEDGVVWQTTVEATATSVILPSYLSGDYQLRLSYSDDFYFYADIHL